MTPEAVAFLAYARTMLARGRVMLGVELHEEAGRAAYMASFHATQALIFEREGRIVKTHNGVRSEFHRLTRAEATIDDALRDFFSGAYGLKTAADYDPRGEYAPTPDEVQAALDMAARLVDALEAIIRAG